MKDVIKEILEESIYCNYDLHTCEKKKLLDYITNSQEENKKLNSILETLKETNKLLINQKYKLEYELDTLGNKYDDYKSRIDKAIKRIYKEKDNLETFEKWLILVELLNILQGDDKE